MSAQDRTSPTLTAADDASLVRSVLAGEPAAFELLMRRYNRRLYRLARAVLRSDEEAEDALQEGYLSAFRSIAQFRQDSALSTWLSRLVLNECLGRLRRSVRRQNVIPMVSSNTSMEMNAMAADDAELPDQVLGRAQMRALLERKLDALPESFRVVFVLRSVEDLSGRGNRAMPEHPDRYCAQPLFARQEPVARGPGTGSGSGRAGPVPVRRRALRPGDGHGFAEARFLTEVFPVYAVKRSAV